MSPHPPTPPACAKTAPPPPLRGRAGVRGQATPSFLAREGTEPEASTRAGPPSLGNLLAWGRERMQRAGVDSPALTALVLLEHATGLSRETLLAHSEAAPQAGALARYEALIGRRCQREPLAYIRGWREFRGRRFSVTRHTLIPRPETEELAALALHRLQRLSPQSPEARLLEVGTGSGAIVVTLLAEVPGLRAVATDIDSIALRVARANAVLHGVQDRLYAVGCNLADAIRGRFPVIVANLPYVPTRTIDSLEPEVARYEPRQALDGGPDGMDVLARFIQSLPVFLATPGAAFLEIGHDQGQRLATCAASSLPNASITLDRDAAYRERFLVIEAEG